MSYGFWYILKIGSEVPSIYARGNMWIILHFITAAILQAFRG